MDPNKQMLEETYRLTKENNRMLHSMRRNAFWSGVIKFIFYIIVLVIAPLWIYTTYLQPVIASMEHTINQLQGTNTKAQAQFGSLQEMWRQLESQFGSSSAPR